MRYPVEEYERRLQLLVDDAPVLTMTLRRVAAALQEQDLDAPTWELVDDLQFYRSRFSDLEQEILGPDSVPVDHPERLATLRERLGELSHRERACSEIREALRVNGTTPEASVALSHIEAYVEQATSGTNLQLPHAQVVVSSLMKLVSADNLSDADWEAARTCVANEISQEVAVAAVRGRLRLDSPIRS